MGLSAARQNIKSTLESDAALAAWVSATFPGKTLKVVKAQKRRQEINVGDLPVAMITAPRRQKAEGATGTRRYKSGVLIYLGIHFDADREQALDLMEQFEDLVEDALLRDWRRGQTAVNTEFVDSANDEGVGHPIHFSVLQFDITTERGKP